MCLDTLGRNERMAFELGVYLCQNSVSASQVFSYTYATTVRREDVCLSSYIGARPGNTVRVMQCRGDQSEEWSHVRGGPIMHKQNGLCLDLTGLRNGDLMRLQKCDSNLPDQRWSFGNYSSTFY